jgi:hypothetical protein
MFVSVQIDRLLQAGAEPTPNGCPRLTLAVVGDQAVALGGGVQRILDLALAECPGSHPPPELPGSLVQTSIPNTRWQRCQLIYELRHVAPTSAPFPVRRIAPLGSQ